jgi:hypothetical protein
MKYMGMVLLLLSALLISAVAPGTAGQVRAATEYSQVAAAHTHSHAAAFDKTKFVLHLAVAAFLIHYIYKKYKAGKLGRTHLITDVKAAAAALIAYHELKAAYNDAKSSNSATLHALIAPINLLLSGVNTASSKLKHGDTSSLSSLNSQEGTFATLAAKNGYGFKDTAPSGFGGF